MYPERRVCSFMQERQTQQPQCKFAKCLSMVLEGKDGSVSVPNQVPGRARDSCLGYCSEALTSIH